MERRCFCLHQLEHLPHQSRPQPGKPGLPAAKERGRVATPTNQQKRSPFDAGCSGPIVKRRYIPGNANVNEPCTPSHEPRSCFSDDRDIRTPPIIFPGCFALKAQATSRCWDQRKYLSFSGRSFACHGATVGLDGSTYLGRYSVTVDAAGRPNKTGSCHSTEWLGTLAMKLAPPQRGAGQLPIPSMLDSRSQQGEKGQEARKIMTARLHCPGIPAEIHFHVQWQSERKCDLIVIRQAPHVSRSAIPGASVQKHTPLAHASSWRRTKVRADR